MQSKNYPHKDHRRRVREAFRKGENENMPDLAVLELLLFYAIPRRDTKPAAAALIERFGSLEGVASAGYDELVKFDGLGESSALLLSLLQEIGNRVVGKKSVGAKAMSSDEIARKIYDRLKDRQTEAFCAASLDAVGRMTAVKILGEGSESGVTADKRAILEFAFSQDADSLIIAHNHPRGEAAPSAADIELTAEMGRLLAETGIKLADHLIVCPDSYLSLASTEKFASLFR